MAKILLLALGIWLIVTLLKRYARNISSKDESPHTPEEDMVQCAKCGVHLPKSESLMIGKSYFCCKEHSQP